MGLFDFSKPAWMSKNYNKALRAAEKETDQTKLFEIAQKTHFHPFLEWQLKGLSDKSLFTDIAKNDCEGIVRTAVVNKIGGETRSIRLRHICARSSS